jgi:hypothetical protein
MSASMIAIRGRLQKEGEVIHIICDRIVDHDDMLRSIGSTDFAVSPSWADGAKGGGVRFARTELYATRADACLTSFSDRRRTGGYPAYPQSRFPLIAEPPIRRPDPCTAESRLPPGRGPSTDFPIPSTASLRYLPAMWPNRQI